MLNMGWGDKVLKSTGEKLEEGGHNDDQTSSAEHILQAKAFDEIVRTLLAAGYFRARIATLSEFDKAVGGLCWCITSSGVQVDVDILFEENSSIGAKVQLCEKIIHVSLSRMSRNLFFGINISSLCNRSCVPCDVRTLYKRIKFKAVIGRMCFP